MFWNYTPYISVDKLKDITDTAAVILAGRVTPKEIQLKNHSEYRDKLQDELSKRMKFTDWFY